MRSRPFLLLAAALFTGCATGGLGSYAGRSTPIATRPGSASVKLAPSTHLVLVNPVYCGQFLQGASGSDLAAVGAAILTVGCACVLVVVDLVALPFTAVRRHTQAREIGVITSACEIRDPAPLAGARLAEGVIREFGFQAPPDPETVPPDAVTLVVSTDVLERSSRIAWKASIAFRAPDGRTLWRGECDEKAPTRTAEAFRQDCEAAQKELEVLASTCVENVMARLRTQKGLARPVPTPHDAEPLP